MPPTLHPALRGAPTDPHPSPAPTSRNRHPARAHDSSAAAIPPPTEPFRTGQSRPPAERRANPLPAPAGLPDTTEPTSSGRLRRTSYRNAGRGKSAAGPAFGRAAHARPGPGRRQRSGGEAKRSDWGGRREEGGGAGREGGQRSCVAWRGGVRGGRLRGRPGLPSAAAGEAPGRRAPTPASLPHCGPCP